MTHTRTILLAGAAIAALGACAQSPEQIALSSRAHLQLSAREVTTELKIASIVAGERLGDPERDAVRAFAVQYMREGRSRVTISRPTNGPSDVSALRASADARAQMLAAGIDPADIAEGPYDASGARQAPLMISYRSYEVVAPDCPDVSSVDMSDIHTNSALPSFGCAVTANLAAMIGDPSDLVGTQMLDPSDSRRRLIVMTKYRNGEPTTSTRSDQASGAISSAVGN
jgi:pilus assembly protein CpaD